MSEQQKSEAGELDLEVAGQKIRTRGYRLVDLAWLPLLLLVAYIASMLYQHEAHSQADVKASVDASTNVVNAMKESNKALVEALKESNQNTLGAIKELAAEQRKSTAAMRETACLLDPAIKDRRDGREFCKRMVSGER